MTQYERLGEIQASIKQAGAKWLAVVNPGITNLTADQKRLHLGWKPKGNEPGAQQREVIARVKYRSIKARAEGAVRAYPASFDWRNVDNSNYVTTIKDQGMCGSCTAFGTTATVECQLRWQLGDPNLPVDLSEAHVFYCFGGGCNTGMAVEDALDAYKNTGIVDEDCFPYTAKDQPCNLCSDWQNRVTRIAGWHVLTSADDMKTWLSRNGPLVTAFAVYDDFFSYGGDVYQHISGGYVGGHCVCVVGYDDTRGCWTCKNSWGNNWGVAGFFDIAYGECGIDSTMWAIDYIG